MTIIEPMSQPTVHPITGELAYYAVITPEDAEKILLDRNTHNRTTKGAGKISGLLRDMKRNLFIGLNGQTIAFNVNGTLDDGQHRLIALSKSDKPQEFLVVENVCLAAQATIDTGAKRSVADQLGLAGITNGAAKSAITKNLLVYSQLGFVADSGSNGWRPTETEIRNFVVLNDLTLAASVSLTKTHWVSGNELKYFSPALVGSLHYITRKTAPDLADEFFGEQLIKGLRINSDASPAMAIRKFCTKERPALMRHEQWGYLVKAWNAYRSGTDMKVIHSPQGGWNKTNMPAVDRTPGF